MKELIHELQEATQAHGLAVKATSEARSIESDALNRLSKAQKAIDDYVKGLKAKAPYMSDWYVQTNASIPVER